MPDPTAVRNTHDDVPVEKKFAELHKLIDGIEIAMLTSIAKNGELHSRAMATQRRTERADLWFVTTSESGKIAELDDGSQINVAYINASKEWVSISGTVTLSTDRERIRAEYDPSWKAWFPDAGPGKDGGPNDPRITLIDVHAHNVTYFKTGMPRPIILFEIAKAAFTSSVPILGAVRHLEPSELETTA